jgi:hypothetical protein
MLQFLRKSTDKGLTYFSLEYFNLQGIVKQHKDIATGFHHTHKTTEINMYDIQHKDIACFCPTHKATGIRPTHKATGFLHTHMTNNKDQGSQASRALITMRRSRAEGANNLKVYNVQDYFVIQWNTLKFDRHSIFSLLLLMLTLVTL